jgi:ATP-dependent Clp endopeptidase proteolytic subunit ClpP
MIATFKGFRSEVMQADSEKVLNLYIYDVISVWGVSSADVAEALEDAGTVDRINLYVNSPGGSVFEGLAIHSLLRRNSATIDAYVDSLAASMASVIIMAADKITMMPGSFIMIHNPSGGVYGQAKDFAKYATLLDKLKASSLAIYAKRTKQDREELAKLMDDETWMGPEEAMAKGFADAIDEDGETATAMFDLSGFSHVPETLQHARKRGAAWSQEIAEADAVVLSTVAMADLDNFDLLATALSKRDRVQVPDVTSSVQSQKENNMDPKLMSALKKAGMVTEQATSQTADAVVDTWYAVQNRQKPEASDAIISEIEAGVQFPVPAGKLLTTQDEINHQVAEAKAAAVAEETANQAKLADKAIADTKAYVADVLERCITAKQDLRFAIDMVKLESLDSVKDSLIAKLCKDRAPLGDDAGGDRGKPTPEERFRAEFKAAGGESEVGVTEEQYIRTRLRSEAGGFVR